MADENARQPALEATLALIQAFLFGDGAVAMVLGTEGGRMGVGPMHHLTNQQPVDREILWLEGGGSECPELKGFPRYRMGPAVRSRGPVYAEHTIRAVLGDPDTPISSIPEADVVLIHTGSKIILDQVCQCLRLDPQCEQVATSYKVLSNYGNLSAAAAGFMLEECTAQDGVCLLSTFGLGFSASATTVTVE
ncbi:MAG: hypothetical protein GY856_52185 [bacterium]|nr:hypothetical protein [bacterium]